MKALTASVVFALALAAATVLAADEKAATPAAPQTAPGTPPAAAPAAPKPLDNARASYLIGLSLGEQLGRSGISADALKSEAFAKGVRDALGGAAHFKPEDGPDLNAWLMATRAAAGERNRAAAREFLAKNAKAAGVTTTSSGLQYVVLAAGSGDSPKPADEVTVQYRGTLLNGTEFDSSYRHGKPATFHVNGVIKGWQEALTLMKPGAKFRLFIPPELAYDQNSPPGIPPGSLLKFEVELVSVKPAP
jgi:FKBP-type peptidyl-prolyl cis-trans isomerase